MRVCSIDDSCGSSPDSITGQNTTDQYTWFCIGLHRGLA